METTDLKSCYQSSCSLCGGACHYKRPLSAHWNDAEEAPSSQSILQLFLDGLHTIPWRFGTSRRYVLSVLVPERAQLTMVKGRF